MGDKWVGKETKKGAFRDLTSIVQSGVCCRRSIGCCGRRRRHVEVQAVVGVGIDVVALDGQCQEKHGEEQEAQLSAPVPTATLCFSFAWRSHDLFSV